MRFNQIVEFFDHDLIDYDSRPQVGEAYTLNKLVDLDYQHPPFVLKIGEGKHGVIVAGPINWFSWRPKYPLINREVFNKFYRPFPKIPKLRYPMCLDCGHNTVIFPCCLFCYEKDRMLLEDQAEMRRTLLKTFGSYVTLLQERT